MRRFLTLPFPALALTVIPIALLATQEKHQVPKLISVDSVSTTHVLVGRLGKPLGEAMRLSGKWHYPQPQEKDYSLRFTITSIDGNTLDKPIEFNIAQLNVSSKNGKSLIPALEHQKQLEGKTWSFTAYETGRVQIFPNERDSKNPVFPVVGRPYYTKPFTSEIIGYMVDE